MRGPNVDGRRRSHAGRGVRLGRGPAGGQARQARRSGSSQPQTATAPSAAAINQSAGAGNAEPGIARCSFVARSLLVRGQWDLTAGLASVSELPVRSARTVQSPHSLDRASAPYLYGPPKMPRWPPPSRANQPTSGTRSAGAPPSERGHDRNQTATRRAAAAAEAEARCRAEPCGQARCLRSCAFLGHGHDRSLAVAVAVAVAACSASPRAEARAGRSSDVFPAGTVQQLLYSTDRTARRRASCLPRRPRASCTRSSHSAELRRRA